MSRSRSSFVSAARLAGAAFVARDASELAAARFYKLTRAGRKQLGIEESNWARLTLVIGKVMAAT
jgi:hypothetical protein